jgi:hypothetical protein
MPQLCREGQAGEFHYYHLKNKRRKMVIYSIQFQQVNDSRLCKLGRNAYSIIREYGGNRCNEWAWVVKFVEEKPACPL